MTTASSRPHPRRRRAAPGHRYRRVTVEPVAGACGAVVGGVDLARDLDDDVVAEIRRAILDHQVRVLPRPAPHAGRAGRVQPPLRPVQPGALHRADRRPPRGDRGRARGDRSASATRSAACGTPTSRSCPSRRSRRSCTRSRCRRTAATRIWANQQLAYARCPTACRRCSPGSPACTARSTPTRPRCRQLHDTFAGMTVHTSDDAERAEHHPVVRVHPETAGRRCSRTRSTRSGSSGSRTHESKPILDFLFEHSDQPAFTCRWRWEVGDVAMWDNRCVQHMAMADFTGHRRFMHRTTVAGDRPIPRNLNTQPASAGGAIPRLLTQVRRGGATRCRTRSSPLRRGTTRRAPSGRAVRRRCR